MPWIGCPWRMNPSSAEGGLKNNFDLRYLHLTVPDRRVVHVRGLTESDDEMNRLKEVIGAVDGVSEVRSEVSVRPAVLI